MRSLAFVTPLALAAIVLAPLPVHALVRGQTDAGSAYVTGGIGGDELRELHADRSHYSLWVATLAKGSGAYLANAHVRIVSKDGRRVAIDRSLEGPWLFVDLPPGNYEVFASVPASDATPAQELRTTVRIAKGQHRQAVLRFTSSAGVGPERAHPFGGNPFGPDASVK